MKVNVGIDMGGTRIKAGLIREGAILECIQIPASSHVTLGQRLNEISAEVNRLLNKHNATPSGIGLAFPGIVDFDRKVILSKYVKYPDAQAVSLKDWAASEWSVPLVVENDARAALAGEWQYGAGRGCDDLVLVSLGTGVGSAAMMNGKLLRGRNYLAGNLGGHMSVNINGRQCNCGNTGCLESEASTWSLRQYLKDEPGFESSLLASAGEIGFESLFRCAEKGDALALRIQQSSLKAWALGIINLIVAYDPRRVVIGGGVMKNNDILIPEVNELIRRDLWICDNNIEVVKAQQVENAGILGMSWLVSAESESI